MQTRSRPTRPFSIPEPTQLPGPLATLRMLNQVARSLGQIEGQASPFVAVIEGVRTLLHADGVAVLVRDSSGDYVFRVAHGGLAEWDDYTLSVSGSGLLETLHARDQVTLFKRAQRNPWAGEFLLAAGMNWGALAPIRIRDQSVGALLVTTAGRSTSGPSTSRRSRIWRPWPASRSRRSTSGRIWRTSS